MKILHTSDWHIGRTLYDRKRYDEFEKFFAWLLEKIHSENIDILLIAGDIFDTGTPSNKAQELYYKFICDVNKTKCQHIVIIGGNHDSASFLNAPQSILKSLNVHVIGSISNKPEDEVLNLDSKLIICAVPYLRDKDIRSVSAGESLDDKARNLIQGIKEHYLKVSEIALQKRDELYKLQKLNSNAAPDKSKIPIIAMGHLFAAGGITGDGVRDLYVGSLAYVNIDCFPKCFDYVALGHLHIAQCLGGSEHIRYSGSPLPMGFGEAKQIKKLISLEFNESAEESRTIKEINIPCFQALERLSGDLSQILDSINKLKAASSNAWLEIEYTGAEIIPDLKFKLDESINGSALEIRRIRNKKISESIIKNDSTEENLKDLSPIEVFERCLELNEIVEDEKNLLRASYQEILNSILEEDIRL